MLNPPPHTQEIYFDQGRKLVLRDVEKIEDGEMTHIIANGGGKEFIINTKRVLFIKIYKGTKTDYEK